jgi:hypothetical protein
MIDMDRVEYFFAALTVLGLAVLFGADLWSLWTWLS